MSVKCRDFVCEGGREDGKACRKKASQSRFLGSTLSTAQAIYIRDFGALLSLPRAPLARPAGRLRTDGPIQSVFVVAAAAKTRAAAVFLRSAGSLPPSLPPLSPLVRRVARRAECALSNDGQHPSKLASYLHKSRRLQPARWPLGLPEI